jgi:predicted GNAT family acetyltransferase
MIDNTDQNRFELEENGLLVWADYRVAGGKHILPHVEAEPPLRGTGAASRLMQQIVEYARSHQLVLMPRCSYATAWFQRHHEAEDVLG